MHDHFEILEDLVVEQVLQLIVVALLRDAILCFLPKLIRDVVIGETLAVEHDHLEQVLHTELQVAALQLEVTLVVGVARAPGNLDRVLVGDRLNALRLFHLVLCVRIAVLADQNFIIDGSDSDLDPLDQVNWLVREVGDDLERCARLI